MTGNEFIRLVSETLFGIILGTVLSVPIHESGHLAGGLLTGYKFVSFRIAGVKLVRDCTGFRLKKGSLTPIGQCIMTSDRMDRSPVLLILGGIAANLIFGGLLIILGIMSQSYDEMAFLTGAGGINAAVGVMNAISASPYSDAVTFIEVNRLAGGIELYNRLMCVYAELEKGKDISQISERYLVSSVWKADHKATLNSKEYYMSTLPAELMYYRYLHAMRVYGEQNGNRLEKETKFISKFSGALRLLGYELQDSVSGGIRI